MTRANRPTNHLKPLQAQAQRHWGTGSHHGLAVALWRTLWRAIGVEASRQRGHEAFL